jgi:hypothetical protein
MFLIEYEKGLFVNAEEINRVRLMDGGISFCIGPCGNDVFYVGENYRETFCNHLQAINRNIASLESCWRKS